MGEIIVVKNPPAKEEKDTELRKITMQLVGYT